MVGIVRENINFERGLDPKQALDVGYVHKWLNLKKGNLFWIKRDFTTNFDNRINDNSSYHTFKKDDFLRINDPGQKYEDGTIGFTAYVVNDRVRSNDDFFIWGTPLELEQRLEKVKGMDESVHFERGIEPMDSMKIGRVGERDIKKVLDRLVEIRGGRYKINHIDDIGLPYTEGVYFPGSGYEKVFRADNFFIRYYPASWGNGSTDYFTFGYRIAGKIMNEKILDTAEQGLTEILKCITPLPHDPVSEIQHFERGKDPMRAMKIGRDFRPYKKGDKVKVWVPWEKRLVEVRVYEDEELDTDGNPKIKGFFSSTRPKIEVRRIWIRYNGEVKTANLAIHPDSPEQDRWIMN